MNHRAKAQPKGLFLLIFTEIWERFGFYIVQTILVLYLSKGLKMADSEAYLLYGAFSSMLYLTPVIGGYIADRFIGFRQAIILGAILFMIGYALIAIPNRSALFFGLSIIVLGNGFFKPNVSSIVGDLYADNDPRREGGFTYFYMGINIGSLIPPLFAGALVAAYSYGSGFLLASLGMIFALVTFLVGSRRLQNIGSVPLSSPILKSRSILLAFYALLVVGILVAIGIVDLLLFHPAETNLILVLASIGIIGVLFFYIFKEKLEQRRKMYACLILIVVSIGFWAVYNQTFTSLMLFADRNISKTLLGLPINAEFTQFFNPFFIIIFTPLLSSLWVRFNPSTPAKFALGALFMAIGFIVLGGGVFFFHANGLTSPWWLILSYGLQTIGELLISPIGLAMVTRLSPRHLVGLMMGIWFLVQSAAFAIGGGLATISSVPEGISETAALQIYSRAFLIYGSIALALALFTFAMIPFLKRLIGNIEGPVPTPKR